MNTVFRARQKNSICRFFVNLCILFLLVIFLVGCGTIELDSQWKEQEITIDGKSSDWLGSMYFFEGEDISVGFLNDDSDLYVCLIAAEPTIRAQMMMQGFTAWFDPEGGKEKTFGIRFPLGRQDLRERGRAIDMRDRGREPSPEELQDRFEESLTELEIIGPGGDRRKRILVEEAIGIDIKVDVSSGMVVYELRVSLRQSEQLPYAIGTRLGSSVGVGLEIPKFDRSAMRERMGGRGSGGMGMPGGGRGGMSGGRGSMGMGGGRRPQMPKGLNVWVSLQLASAKN